MMSSLCAPAACVSPALGACLLAASELGRDLVIGLGMMRIADSGAFMGSRII